MKTYNSPDASEDEDFDPSELELRALEDEREFDDNLGDILAEEEELYNEPRALSIGEYLAKELDKARKMMHAAIKYGRWTEGREATATVEAGESAIFWLRLMCDYDPEKAQDHKHDALQWALTYTEKAGIGDWEALRAEGVWPSETDLLTAPLSPEWLDFFEEVEDRMAWAESGGDFRSFLVRSHRLTRQEAKELVLA